MVLHKQSGGLISLSCCLEMRFVWFWTLWKTLIKWLSALCMVAAFVFQNAFLFVYIISILTWRYSPFVMVKGEKTGLSPSLMHLWKCCSYTFNGLSQFMSVTTGQVLMAFFIWIAGKKYKNAAAELIWQCFFPARELTVVPGYYEKRRYHIHETAMQKALRQTEQKAKIPMRVTSHTFRHSFEGLTSFAICQPLIAGQLWYSHYSRIT